jgi:hypothetical protein
MRDIAFFSKLLALKKPWRVERVSLDVAVHRCSCAYGSANYARTDAPANCGPVVSHATVPDLYPLGAA